MTTSPKRCNYVNGGFTCRGAAYYEDTNGPRCYSHRPEQVARAARKEAERVLCDAERGIRRCGAMTLTNRPCPRIAMQGKGTCAQHDPAQQEARAQASVEHAAKKTREHQDWCNRRKVELESGLAALQSRHNALVHDDLALRRSVRDLRAEIERLKRERDAEAKQVDTVAAELLQHARGYLAQSVERITPEQCDLMVRCVEALTRHSREQRLAARHPRSDITWRQPTEWELDPRNPDNCLNKSVPGYEPLLWRDTL